MSTWLSMTFHTATIDIRARVKKKHKKTRTGCVTCKARRVKCDEGKPVCERCSSLGRDCYYRPAPSPSSKSSSDDGELIRRRPSIPLPHLALSPIERTPETAQLQQFCMSTSLAVFRNLGRPFETFWTSAVPSLSYTEPCVAHITVALAARQRASFHVNDSSSERTHLVRTYNKHYMDALRLLTHPDSRSRPAIVLLCCLLFISMENVEDTVSNSFLHLRSGLQVLREWKASREPSATGDTLSANDLIERTLEPMFARFEAAVSPSIYLHGQDDLPVSLRWPIPELPDRFENLATARGALYEIAQWVFSQGHHQMVFKQPHSPEFIETLNLCMKWKAVLDKYEAEKPIDAKKYHVSLLALETNHKLLTLLIRCTTVPNELLWIIHSNTLQTMLEDIKNLNGPTDVPQRRTKMSLMPRMIPAVFTIATICRRRSTQKEAVELINSTHAANHDDECFIAVIAAGVIQLEETFEQESFEQLSSMATRVRPLMAELVPRQPGQLGKVVLTYTRPFIRPLVDDHPSLGPITLGPPKESIDLPWNSDEAPPARTIWLWPVIEFLRLAGSSGLVGPNTGHCLCKTYGALFALMRSIEYVYSDMTESQ